MGYHEQVVTYLATEFTRTPVDLRESYELRLDRPAVWLQRGCLWILRKLRAYRIGETVKVSRHVINANTFMELLFKQRRDLFAHFNMEAEHLLIGAEDYQELMGGDEVKSLIKFDAEYHKDRRILGMRIEVVPWMRGVLVMPTEKRVRSMTQENEEAK